MYFRHLLPITAWDFLPLALKISSRIEDEEERQEDKEVLEQLQIDMLGFVCNGTGKYLARS